MLLFNWVGFRFFSAFMEQRVNTRLEAQLDENNYDETDLISIKLPSVHLSSYSLAGQFERVDGEVTVNGVQYKYVKRRIFNDSLEYLCIPNEKGMQVLNARDDFFKLVNDLQHTGQGKKAANHTTVKNATVDYTDANNFTVNVPAGAVISSPVHRNFVSALPVASSPTYGQPPERC